jgi:hypothetical protein
LNYGHIQKGTTLSQSTIETILGFTADSNIEKYNLERMNLVGTIEQAIRREQSIEVVIKYVGRELRILTDPEAAVEVVKRHENAVKKIRRTARKASDIDHNELNPEELERHEFMQRKTQHQLDALNRSRRSSSELLQPAG